MAWEAKKSRMGAGSMHRPWIVVDKDAGLTYMNRDGDRPKRFLNKTDARHTASYLNFQRQLGNDLGSL